MKRAVASLLVLATSVAHAEQRTTIQAPRGWRLDKAQSEELGRRLDEVNHFGLDRAAHVMMANADVYVAPEPGVVLTVVLVGAKTSSELPAVARAAVDELHAASQRASLAGSGIVEEGWQEKVDTAAKQIEATLAWRDTNAKTRSTSRLLVVADSTHVYALTGECFASDDASPARVEECKAALATLDPGIAPDQRIVLSLAPAGTVPAPPEAPAAREPARMGDGSRTPLPPITIPQEGRATDRRPVYVGFGLVILAALFWWNRRRRAQREDKAS